MESLFQNNLIQSNKKILIVGGNGFIGDHLFQVAKHHNLNIRGTFRENKSENDLIHLDITEKGQIEKVLASEAPDVIIWVAALKNVSLCKTNEKLARAVNVESVASACDYISSSNLDTKFVFISSDYVFDGSKGSFLENDKTAPDTNYGKTKLEAEEIISSSLENFAIIRTSAVMGKGSAFLSWLVEELKKGQSIEMFSDVMISPTPVRPFAERLLSISLDGETRGVHHIVGDKEFSKFEFAKALKELSKDFSSKLIPITVSDNDLFRKRSTLSSNCEDNLIKTNWASFFKDTVNVN